MFNKVCGVNLINEDVENVSSVDINKIMAGYIKDTMTILSGATDRRSNEKPDKPDNYDDGDVEYADQEGDEEDFGEKIGFDNIAKLVEIYRSMNIENFISEHIEEDSQIELYNDIKFIIKDCGNNSISVFIDAWGLEKFGGYILYMRNKIMSLKHLNNIHINKLHEACDKIGGVNFDVYQGKLVYVKTNQKGGQIV
jgi:hypothetical protein